MVIGYFVIAFIIFFFMYKKYMLEIVEKSKKDYLTQWADQKEFWIMVLVPLLWVAAIPMYLFWNLLEKIYKKYFNDNNG